ncbi:hypothetical protein BJ912DRAFT_953597 [Pholiota molesta]|nr:hypothetical protein BJ912DRAFT_953597 [Pholiota molesta]
MAFEQLIRTPSLINLELFYLDDFPIPWFLASSTSLKNLSVSYIENPTDSTQNIAFGPNPPVLRSFTAAFKASDNIGRSLLTSKRPDGLPVVDFTALENLKITAIESNITESETMQMCLYASTTLRNLHLEDRRIRFEFANYIHPHSGYGARNPYFGAHDEVVKLHEYFMNPQVWNKITFFQTFLPCVTFLLKFLSVKFFPQKLIFGQATFRDIARHFSMFANEPRIELTLAVHGSLYTDPVVVL